MNPFTRAEVLNPADQCEERRDNPRLHTVAPERSIDEQTRRQNRGNPHVPDERAFETISGGPGI
jgi:hypothetical protein